MNAHAGEQAQVGIEAAATGGESLIGIAMLGKTAAALALVLAIILVAAVLLRRWGLARQAGGRQLRVVDSTAVGAKERVVIVEVRGTWLVLGVGSGAVNPLHTLPAPDASDTADETRGAGFAPGDSFATRFTKALKHNAGLGGRSEP